MLATELDIPVIAASQLNREIEKRSGGPRLADLRESGEIEQAADVVIFLTRDEGEGRVVKVDIEKNRNGPTGMVELAFLRQFAKFADLSRANP
jgi:replicative DNA helicase